MRNAISSNIASIATILSKFAGAIALYFLIAPDQLAHSIDAPLHQLRRVEIGSQLFNDTRLSADGKLSCRSCHDPKHGYSDSRARSVGVFGRVGTRNAPSLIGITHDSAFFWDGRRTNIDDAVIDAFTNTQELGLSSTDDLLQRIRQQPQLVNEFSAAFPDDTNSPTLLQVVDSLKVFLDSAKSEVANNLASSPALAERGNALFVGRAGCAECHVMRGAPYPESDFAYHASGVELIERSKDLVRLVKDVSESNLSASDMASRILMDADWSSLGRFCVTLQPTDIGVFRTPSLRNVAITGPYMHNGSIVELGDVVDHEIYYHARFNPSKSTLSSMDRQAIVAYLYSLKD